MKREACLGKATRGQLIDVILAMLVMLVGIMLFQYEPICLSPEFEGLHQIDSVAANSTALLQVIQLLSRLRQRP